MLRLLSLLLEIWNIKIYITYQCVACFCQMNVCRCARRRSDSGVFRLVSKAMAMSLCKTEPTCDTQTACKATSFAVAWNMHQYLRLHVFQEHVRYMSQDGVVSTKTCLLCFSYAFTILSQVPALPFKPPNIPFSALSASLSLISVALK